MRFVHWQVAWMLTTALFLVVLRSLSLALFLALAVFGLLVVTELTAPLNVAPRWRSRLRRVVAVGLLCFGVLALLRVRTILSLEVVA